jgi:hypothetical protein
MNEGNFPVRYLGVPLIAKRLLAADCSVLVDHPSFGFHHKMHDPQNNLAPQHQDYNYQ